MKSISKLIAGVIGTPIGMLVAWLVGLGFVPAGEATDVEAALAVLVTTLVQGAFIYFAPANR